MLSYKVTALWTTCILGLCFIVPRLPAQPQRTATPGPVEATITNLIKSRAKFDGKRVRVLASFHTDGMHRSVLLEPNCGLYYGTSKTPPPNQPQCDRGVAFSDSEGLDNDPGNKRLDEILGQGERSTADKHIAAEFIGIFRCRPSCASPKTFRLETEQINKLEVVWKNLKPHLPEK